ncbi:glycosyltransferase family 4 protein [Cohnella laeviribosi]|jgi:glycosyltransferase involved in cell wall biosynthesis|uniref:glycosyltransferase family 4 protein n=1 Tax=Cohnella laeviribosi TaxID=380174 RepID=UPI003D1E4CFF
MIINQLLPAMSYGDAVSNSAINIMNLLRSKGIKSDIYAEHIHPKVSNFVRPASKIPHKEAVIYHLAIGCDLPYILPDFTGKRMIYYHNITPSEFFRGYDEQSERLCKEGREQLKFLQPIIDFALAASEYNRKELVDLGYSNTAVSPIIVDYEDYNAKPNLQLLNHLRQTKRSKDILFVGRLAPNKKQEDIIKAFFYYKKYIDKEARLFLVGSYTRMEKYYEELKTLIDVLKIEDVTITGHVPFDHILAYYKNADLLLSMSEHEGFCVPLLEAMYFEVPILTFKSSAISETLGNGGLLFTEKDFKAVACAIEVFLNDSALIAKVLQNQKERLQYFSKQNTQNIFWNHIKAEMNIG